MSIRGQYHQYLVKPIGLFALLLASAVGMAQTANDFPKTYSDIDYSLKLDSLRNLYGQKISYQNADQMELATLLVKKNFGEVFIPL